MSVRLSVLSYVSAAPTGRISVKCYHCGLLRKSAEKLPIGSNLGKNIGTLLHEDLNILYCCLRHKLAVRAFLSNTVLLYYKQRHGSLTIHAYRIVAFTFAVVVTLALLNITFSVHCPSCFYERVFLFEEFCNILQKKSMFGPHKLWLALCPRTTVTEHETWTCSEL
jgi:hypothetical protein